MRPADLRLLRYARAAPRLPGRRRRPGLAGAALILAQAGLLAYALATAGLGAAAAMALSGTLTRVPLAVVTLTALAVFEAVTVLPVAALQLGAARASATRIVAVLEAPVPVADPRIPCPALPLPTTPTTPAASLASPAPPGSAALTRPTASMSRRCC